MLFAQTAQKYLNSSNSAATDKSVKKEPVQNSFNKNESIFSAHPKYEALTFGKARMGIFANKVADNTLMDEYVGSKGDTTKNVTQTDINPETNTDTVKEYEAIKTYIEDSETDIYDDDDDVIEKPKEHKIIGVSRDLGTPLNNYFKEIASGMYAQAVYDIQHTNYGDRLIRKKKMNKVITETFFYGANRFGNNFIA